MSSRKPKAARAAAATRARAIAYVRVSTDKQAERGHSVEAQHEKLSAYAALYDLEIIETIEDAGESAASLARPGLERALQALEARRADALLVVKLDRLTRSVRDLGALVERCQREGWALLSVSESIDTRTAAGRLVLNVLGSVSQWEREAIGERTSAAMRSMAARGLYTGGAAPYGFARSSSGELTPVPSERKAIALAARLRGEGMSLRDIGQRLESRGFRPRSGGRWHAQSIKGLLARLAA